MAEAAVRAAINDMEDAVLSTVDLLNAISVIAEAGSRPMTTLDHDECEGLVRVVRETLRYANEVKAGWNTLFELTMTVEAT